MSSGNFRWKFSVIMRWKFQVYWNLKLLLQSVIISLLSIGTRAFILYLISGSTDSSILSPIMLEHWFKSWGLGRGWGIGSALALWGKDCHLLSLCPSFANISMQSIVFNLNSDSVQSGLLMIWVDVITAQDVSVQAKDFYMLIGNLPISFFNVVIK